MDYIKEINAFERWCENNYLPISSQLLWYKIMQRFNRNGWREWVSVDNLTLMAAMQMSREATFIKARDELIKAGLMEYQKGKKGTPNRYRMISFFEKNTFKSEVQSVVENVVQTVVESEVQSVVESVDINKHKTKNNKKSNPNGLPEKQAKEYLPNSFEMRCVERLTAALTAQLPSSRIPKSPDSRKRWAREIERMKRLDGRSEADIWEALEYAATDPFWQTNIRSTAKLREKFETLILQARQKRGQVGKEAGKKPRNRFHNCESHGYDYEDILEQMGGFYGQEKDTEEQPGGD